MQLALVRADLGDVYVEVADRVVLELPLRLRLALQVGQAGDAVALVQAVQARSGQVRDRILQRLEAVIERQQRVSSERDAGRFFLG